MTGSAPGTQNAMLEYFDRSTSLAIRKVACSVPPTAGHGSMWAIREVTF
jgi:hypothetical protein